MESAVSHSIPVVHPPSAYADDRARRRKPKPSFAILSEPRRLMAGETLFVVGDAATSSFRILDGAIMVLRRCLAADARYSTLGGEAGRSDSAAMGPAS